MNRFKFRLACFLGLIIILPVLVVFVNTAECEGILDMNPLEETFDDKEIKFDISLEKEKYQEDEPIKINCKFTNLREDTLNLLPTLHVNTIIFISRDSKNFGPLGVHLLIKEVIEKESMITSKPGEVYKFQKYIMKEMHTMPKPGKYQLLMIYFNFDDEFYGIEPWHGRLRSNIVEFEVEH